MSIFRSFSKYRNPDIKKLKTSFIILFLIILTGLIFLNVNNLNRNKQDLRSKAAESQNSFEPISGTFVDFNYIVDTTKNRPTVSEWDSLFQEMKNTGIDTVIVMATGFVGKTANGRWYEWDYFDNGLKYQDSTTVMERFLNAAFTENINLYIGLAGNDLVKAPIEEGSKLDINSSRGRIIYRSLQNIKKVKDLCTKYSCDWNLIKGFYIPQEKELRVFLPPWNATASFFTDISSEVKKSYPDKKIIISPYQSNGFTFNKLYQSVYSLVQNTNIDIISPQDSVGSGIIKIFATSKINFKALSSAIKDANKKFNKTVEAWANIETFNPDQTVSNSANGLYSPPDIYRVTWQIRAVDEYVSKQITWIYTWSLATSPFLNDLNIPQYSSTFARQRTLFRSQYLSKPIITAVFPWYENGNHNIVIKGYNFGYLNQNVKVYLHYISSKGNFATYSGSFPVSQIVSRKSAIFIPVSLIPEFDLSKPYDLAIMNSFNSVGFDSNNPNNVTHDIYYAFPEIKK